MSLTLIRRYNADRFGYLIPHRYGNLPMVGAVATYRPGEGRFGGAVAVEEATVNLVSNPTSWVAKTDEHQTTVETDERFLGCVVSETTKVSSAIPTSKLADLTIQPGETYTASIYVKIIRRSEAPSHPPRIVFWESDGSGNLATGTAANIIGEWQRVIATYTNNTDEPILVSVFYYPTSEAGAVTRQAAPQLEQKPFATSFVDGTRADGRLEYPQSIWNHATGTFAAWVKTPTDVTTDRVLTIQWARDSINVHTRFGLRMNTSGRFVASYGSIDTLTTADSYNDGRWHHVALTWVDGTADVHLYVDGERIASADSPISLSNPGGRYGGVIPIGHRGYTYNDQWWNGLIDELLILPYAASEEEIVSWYEAQGPLPPHSQASLQWDRQMVRPAQMVKL